MRSFDSRARPDLIALALALTLAAAGSVPAGVMPKTPPSVATSSQPVKLGELGEKVHTEAINALAFSPDGRLLFLGGQDRKATIWDVERLSLDFKIDVGSPVAAVAALSDGSAFAAAGRDGSIQLWHPVTHAARQSFTNPAEVTALVASPQASRLFAGGFGGVARIHDLQGGEPVLLKYQQSLLSAALAGDGRIVVTGHAPAPSQSSIGLWNGLTGQRIRRPLGPTGAAGAIAIDGKGERFAVGDANGVIHLYETSNAESYYTLRGTVGAVRGLAFREGGQLLASVGNDGALRLWDLGTRSERAKVDAHPGRAVAVAFAPGGRKLATAGEDGRARLWDVSAFSEPLPPTELQRLLQAGHDKRAAQDFEGSAKAFAQAVEKFPQSAEAHLRFGLTMLGSDRPKAAAEFEKALQLSPEDVDVNFWLGSLRRREGNLVEARSRFEVVLRGNPNLLTAYNELAEVEKAAKDLQALAGWYERANSITPRDPGTRYNVACGRALVGDKDGAIEWLKLAIEAGFNKASNAETDSDFASIKDDPRFKAILAKLASSTAGIEATGEPSEKYQKLGSETYDAGKTEEALLHFRRALAEERARKPNSRSARQALALYWVGLCHHKLERNQDALAAWEEALTLAPDEIKSLTLLQIADMHERLGQYGPAAEAYRRALPIQRRADEPGVLSVHLGMFGELLVKAGQYDEAMRIFDEGLALRQADFLVRLLLGKASVYAAWGQKEKQFQTLREALTEAGKDKETGLRLRVLPVLARGLASDGQNPEAFRLFDQWIDLLRPEGNSPQLVVALQSKATAMAVAGDRGALAVSEEALEIARKIGRRASVGLSLLAKGEVQRRLKDNAAAAASFKEALGIGRAEKDEQLTLLAIDLLSVTDGGVGASNDAEGLALLKERLQRARTAGAQPELAEALSKVGIRLSSLQQWKEGSAYLGEAVQIVEKLRKTATGEARRDFVAREVFLYEALSKSLLNAQDVVGFFRTTELSRARLLAEKLTTREDELTVPSVADIQRLAQQGSVLLYSHSTWASVSQLKLTRRSMRGLASNTSEWTAAILSGNPVQAQAAAQGQRGLTKKTDAAQSIKAGDDGLERVIQLYRALLQDPSDGARERTKAIGRVLYDKLIEPHTSDLREGEDLVIVPDGVLAFLPFETFVDAKGKYLTEKYRVRYVQSLSVLDLISKRRHPAGRKPMLAFGGARYEGDALAAATVESQAQLTALQGEVDKAILGAGSLRKAYAAIGVEAWTDLPGTLDEVKGLQRLVPGAEIITGADVRESRIKQLSASGQLAGYRVLHFATHGLVVPQLPELSALVLSQAPDGAEDGYLRMGEIGQLKLKADYVNLSACETGLGKIYGGEGVVGLTQALLIAGANGVSVSLWQVADASTAKFMQELYRVAAEKNLSYAAAATEVKRAFIRGDFGAAWTAPYYWAPFVHYGQ